MGFMHMTLDIREEHCRSIYFRCYSSRRRRLWPYAYQCRTLHAEWGWGRSTLAETRSSVWRWRPPRGAEYQEQEAGL